MVLHKYWKLTDVGIPRALGRHIQTFGPNATEEAYIGLFSCELTYTGVIVLVKFSILALYWRIFSKTNIKIPISILATGVCMWGIAVVSVIFPPSSRRLSLTVPVFAHVDAMYTNPRIVGSFC